MQKVRDVSKNEKIRGMAGNLLDAIGMVDEEQDM